MFFGILFSLYTIRNITIVRECVDSKNSNMALNDGNSNITSFSVLFCRNAVDGNKKLFAIYDTR